MQIPDLVNMLLQLTLRRKASAATHTNALRECKDSLAAFEAARRTYANDAETGKGRVSAAEAKSAKLGNSRDMSRQRISRVQQVKPSFLLLRAPEQEFAVHFGIRSDPVCVAERCENHGGADQTGGGLQKP